MIRTPMLHALTLLLLGGGVLTSLPVHAQPYPPSPSFEAVVKDAQKDGILDTLKGLGVPESHLKSVKFEKINAQDRRNFKTDVSYYKENARKFDDRMISWIIAVVPKAALGASFRVPVAVHYTRYVEANDNWTLLNKWQFHSTVHGLDVMVAPPDLGMPTNAEKVAAIDTFFASRPDLSAHRFMTRNILSVLKTGIYTPHAEQGVHEARDLVTFVWQLAARVELAKERSEEGVTESTFDNVLFNFLVNRSPDGRFTVTKLDTVAECSAADAEAAGIGGEERKEVVNPSPLKVGNMRSAGWAAVQKRRAPFTEEPGSHEHLKRMAAQFEAVLKGFRFQAASEARALDAWAAPESKFKADEAWQQLMDKVTVRAIEEQSAGAPFTFTGARVVSSTVESAHRPESGDSFRTIPAMGQVQYVFKYKVQYKLENKPQELEATVTVDAGFYGIGDKFLASKFEVR